jgi:hypothetical protein
LAENYVMTNKAVLASAAVLASMLLASIGSAEDAISLRKGPWPIRNGHNYQPTERELEDLKLQDVTPDQAREIDRLYDELLGDSEKAGKRHPTSKQWARDDDEEWVVTSCIPSGSLE